METFFITRKLWALEGRKIAKREVNKAKFMLSLNLDARPSWKERMLGNAWRKVHYRTEGRKLIMF